MTSAALADLKRSFYIASLGLVESATLDMSLADLEFLWFTSPAFSATYANATDDGYKSKVVGDTNDRFVINADGKLEWGPGNAALDVNLFRPSSTELRSNANIEANLELWARMGGAAQLKIGAVGPSSEAGIVFGSALDTNLYRSAANTLKTDDSLIISQTTGNPSLDVTNSNTGKGAVAKFTGVMGTNGTFWLNIAALAMDNGSYAGGTNVGGVISFGTGAPVNANGANGDIYFRVDGGAGTTMYQRLAGVWVGKI